MEEETVLEEVLLDCFGRSRTEILEAVQSILCPSEYIFLYLFIVLMMSTCNVIWFRVLLLLLAERRVRARSAANGTCGSRTSGSVATDSACANLWATYRVLAATSRCPAWCAADRVCVGCASRRTNSIAPNIRINIRLCFSVQFKSALLLRCARQTVHVHAHANIQCICSRSYSSCVCTRILILIDMYASIMMKWICT